LQEEFWDLAVMRDRFSVTLSFGNVPEPMVIPFESITTFVDPSVEFGLRFDAHEEGEDGPEDIDPPPPTPIKPPPAGHVVSLDKFRKH